MDDTNQLQLDTPAPTEQLQLANPSPIPVNEAAASTRSQKATVGLTNVTGQGYDDIYRQISGGQEDTFRASSASTMDFKDQMNRQQTLSRMAADRGELMSSAEVNQILGSGKVNPDTVIEDSYAHTYVKETLDQAAKRIDDNVLTTAQTEDPDLVDKFMNKASSTLSRREYAISQAQNLQPAIDNDAFFHIPFPERFGGPIAVGSKNSPWWTMLNWATMGVSGALRQEKNLIAPTSVPTQQSEDQSMAQQSKDLLQLPSDQEFKDKFDKRLEELKTADPTMAQEWAVAMAGQSTDEMITRRAMEVLPALQVAEFGGTMRSFRSGAGRRAADNLGRPMPPSSGNLVAGADGVMRPAAAETPTGSALQAQKAVEDILRQSPANPTKSSMAEAAGDTKEAAVQKYITSVNTPNPQKDVLDTLFDAHQANQTAIRNAPGNNSREELTRMLDAGETYMKDAKDTIMDTPGLVRLPALEEEGFRDIADRQNAVFRGRENSIVNIDMVHDPFTNTTWHVYTLGDYTGRPHVRIQDAMNHAEQNGYGQPVVVGLDPDVYYLPKAAVFELKSTERFETASGKVHIPNENTQYVTPEEKNAYLNSKGITGGRISNGEIHLITDHANGAFIKARKEPSYGLVPVEFAGKEAPKFGEELAASRTKDEIQPRSNFVSEQRPETINQLTKEQTEKAITVTEQHLARLEKNLKPDSSPKELDRHTKAMAQGKANIAAYRERLKQFSGKSSWRFYYDDPQGTRAEVMPTVDPGPTDIPFNTRTGKFQNPLPYGPQIHQNGLGFHIKWSVPVNETDNFLRENHLIKTLRTKSTSSGTGFHLFNDSILSYLRLPQDTLSAAENDNRFKLVYGENKYMNLVRREMQYVQDLYNGLVHTEANRMGQIVDAAGGYLVGRNYEVWNDFKRALTTAQKYPHPVTGEPGYYFKTPLEIYHHWMTAYDRPPSFAEQQAYLAVQRLNNFDWLMRDLSLFKNKARLGVMEHRLRSTVDGKTILSEPFEGAFQQAKKNKKGIDQPLTIPGGDAPVLIHEKDGSHRYYNALNTTDKKPVREDVRNGVAQVIHLYDPDEYPVKVTDKDNNPVRVQYVVSYAHESNPIALKQLGMRDGAHWDYNYDNYLKQPIVRRFVLGGKTHWVYEGDRTFAPIKSRADGERILERLNKVRQLLADKKVGEAKALHQTYMDIPWKDFVKHFYPRKNRATGELEPSRFSLFDDFRVVPKGKTIGEYHPDFLKKYRGMTKSRFTNSALGSGSPARNFQVEYTGARDSKDLFEPVNTGSIAQPMYKFQPAELTDPLVALTRGLRRIIQSNAKDDYTYSAVEHWLAENMDKLKGTPEENWATPMSTFMNGELNRRFKGDPKGQAAESNRWKIKKLLGQPTILDTQIHMVKQYLADAYFNTDSKFKKNALIVPASWTLSKVNNPVQFMRGMAFHENLGFWNWAQIAAQNAAYVNFFALSPTHAIPGTFGAWMHLFSRINKADPIVAHLSKAAEKFGWKPGEWKEAMTAYDKSGFGEIGRTLAIHDPDQQFLISQWKDLFLHKGTILFDLAEQNVRHGAWYTAYHEYKRAFPNTPITRVELGKISSRANDLYMNMGRDSKSALNTGATSMTLQFFKYIENAGNMFYSKRIGNMFGKDNTWQFRARQRASMFLAYSLFFGAAGATGLTLLPMNTYIRQYELRHGYVPGQNLASSLAMEGPASVAGAYLSGWWRTGKWDMSKGTFYNYNDRYGANGYQLLQDLTEGNSTLWKIVLGASGSTLANNIASLSPFMYAWKSAFNDERDNPFTLTFDDWLKGAENINSVRYLDRLIYAEQFGKWIDRHHAEQQDVGKLDAVLRTILGANDQNLDDLYLLNKIKGDRVEAYKAAQKDFMTYARLQAQDASNGDFTNFVSHGKNMNFIVQSAGIPVDEFSKWTAQMKTELNPTQQQAYDSFYHRLVPVDEQAAANAAYMERYRQSAPISPETKNILDTATRKQIK